MDAHRWCAERAAGLLYNSPVRIAVTIGRLLCVLVCIGLIGLWIRSRPCVDLMYVSLGRRYLEVTTIPDQFRVTSADAWAQSGPRHFTNNQGVPRNWPIFGQGFIRVWMPVGVGLAGGSRTVMTYSPGGPLLVAFTRYSIVAIPFGLPASLFGFVALFPTLLSLRRRRRQLARVAAGRCARCGYDLRGGGERCPECGTPIAPHTGALVRA